MKLCGESLDEIRKEVVREHGGLPRGAMWALRGNAENLKEEQRNLREQICKEHGKIARALSLRGTFGSISPAPLEGQRMMVLSSGIASDGTQTNPGPNGGAPNGGNVSSPSRQ